MKGGFVQRRPMPHEEEKRNLEPIIKGVGRALRSFRTDIAVESLPHRLAQLVERLSELKIVPMGKNKTTNSPGTS